MLGIFLELLVRRFKKKSLLISFFNFFMANLFFNYKRKMYFVGNISSNIIKRFFKVVVKKTIFFDFY